MSVHVTQEVWKFATELLNSVRYLQEYFGEVKLVSGMSSVAYEVYRGEEKVGYVDLQGFLYLVKTTYTKVNTKP